MELITVMRIYYNRTVNHGVAIFLVLTAQGAHLVMMRMWNAQ
ncbi:unnamed protein product, partial [Didymodactylos carnosus]